MSLNTPVLEDSSFRSNASGTHINSEIAGSTLNNTSDEECCSSCRNAIYIPKFVLFIFMFMNFLTYYDRGVIAAALTNIKTDSQIASSGVLSSTQSGALVSVFMVGFMITCPLFAMFEKWMMPSRIVCIGLVLWIIAVITCSMSLSYYVLAAARSFVGIGEAAYAGFVPTMIDDMAPKSSRTLWLGMYFSMIPVGQAAGMAIGGMLCTSTIGTVTGWRVAFFTEALAMAPVVLAIMFLPSHYNPRNSAMDPLATISSEDEGKRLRNFAADATISSSESMKGALHVTPIEAVKLLFSNPVWVLTTFGYGMFTFVIGGLAVWGITFLQEGPMRMSHSAASVAFGVCTAITGLLGTGLGGKALDWMGGSVGLQGVRKCHMFDTAMIIIGTPAALLALMTTNTAVFFSLLFVGELTMFCTAAPVNAATITIVAANLRTYAMSYGVFIIHLFGDFPSAMVTGALADYFSNGCKEQTTELGCNTTKCEWVLPEDKGDQPYCVNELQMRNSLLIVVSMLSLCGALWGAAWAMTARLERQRLQ